MISGHARTNEAVDIAVKKLSNTLTDKTKRTDLARQLNFPIEDVVQLLEATSYWFERVDGPTRVLRSMRI